MVDDLIPQSVSDEPSQTVPHWLVAQQREHVRTAGLNIPVPKKPVPADLSADAAALVRKQGSTVNRDQLPLSQPQPPDDEDLIMVDLLDGAHLHTKNSPVPNKMSSNSDSIISLPPLDNRSSRWGELRAESQAWRRLHRGGHSLGGPNVPSYIQDMRTPSSPPKPRLTRLTSGRGEEKGVAQAVPQTPPRRPRADDRPPKGDERAQFKLPLSGLPDRATDRPHTSVNVLPDGAMEGLKERTQERAQKDRRRTGNKAQAQSENGRDAQQGNEREVKPLLSAEKDGARALPTNIPRTRAGSFHIQRDMFMEDDGISTVQSSSSKGKRSSASKKGTWRRRRGRDFQPGAWGWRMPAEEDVVMPSGAWIYLPLIGMLTFIVAYSVSASANAISDFVISPLATLIGKHFGQSGPMWATASLRGASLAISFLLVLYLSPQYAAGSGIPEMKCVLSGVMMPRMLNLRTLLAKMVGLTFSLASSISIGRLGPFIHMSGIIAALVSKIPWFSTLHNSARFQLQALSAAMAAGVGATFGAPIGGTMLSIEVMSTYYYIHWLPMAMYCSIMGYYFVVSFVEAESHAFFSADVNVELQLESGKRLLTYITLGIICGVVGAALVQFTKMAFQVRRKYFTNATPVRTTVMVAMFAVFHTVLAVKVGGIIAMPQRNGVGSLFSEEHDSQYWFETGWKPFGRKHWDSSASLLISLGIKFVLTGISLIMPVPAGTFMPIFETGALLGRAFGEVCCGFAFVDWVDPRATAIIGAAALTSGALHTTSVAVVMLELTREAIDVLPLAVGVIVSYGVSKQLCSDLFSEFIKIRRLPFILGLRERYPSENHQFYEDVSTVVAGSFMSTDFPYVTPSSTKSEVFRMLTSGGKPWINCAFLSDNENRRLWGTISQESLWKAIGDDMPSTVGSVDEEQGYGSMGRDSRGANSDDELVPFLQNFDPAVGSSLVDMGPMQVSYSTPFWKIITFFRMLSMSTMYVMKDGVTIGCVSKAQVISQSIDIEHRAKRQRHRKKQVEKQRKRDEQELMQQLRRDPQTSNRLASRMSEKDLVNMCSASSSGRRSRQNSISMSRR